MSRQAEILERIDRIVLTNKNRNFIPFDDARESVKNICRCKEPRALTRVLMACALAKIDNPNKNITKPYTKIGGSDTFSGRTYDEAHIEPYILIKKLPCNSSTGFLTPALRNIDKPLARDLEIVGKNPELYVDAMHIINDVQDGRYSAEDLLSEIIKNLYEIKERNDNRLQTCLDGLAAAKSDYPISVDKMINLIFQHMSLKNTSRLPVLIVASAYRVASENLKMKGMPLEAHNAADVQTESLGDVNLSLIDDDNIIASYEIKDRIITRNDIDKAIIKIKELGNELDNYYFVTTKPIDRDVYHYALSFYDALGGVEIIILDCFQFLKHFLYLFPKLRTDFIEEYQRLLINEPTSAVSQNLKEAFITMRAVEENQNEED